MAFALKPRQTVLFTGDSITDMGRRNNFVPLGNGYAQMAVDLIAARYPAHGCTFINTGISGHCAHHLFNRWSDDVIRHQPDWVSLMIGINDVHKWLNKATDVKASPDEYACFCDSILHRVRKETKAQIILIDPFYISTDRAEGSFRRLVLENLPAYIKVIRNLARKYKTRHVPMHDIFQQQLKYAAPDRFCPEPVHPNFSGHLLMAHHWLKAMDF